MQEDLKKIWDFANASVTPRRFLRRRQWPMEEQHRRAQMVLQGATSAVPQRGVVVVPTGGDAFDGSAAGRC